MSMHCLSIYVLFMTVYMAMSIYVCSIMYAFMSLYVYVYVMSIYVYVYAICLYMSICLCIYNVCLLPNPKFMVKATGLSLLLSKSSS